jgi:pimeloyl-ACP methyl ester carboxylesterase/CubicO group peptidase (beta-lactamase class C family)
MSQTISRRLFLQGCAATLAGAGASNARAASIALPDFRWLDLRLHERVDNGWFDGMGLVIGRGEALWHEAYFGNGGPDVTLHVASTGKWTAAAAIAALVDEGKLSWDDPAHKFLPQLDGPKGSATLRQLMSHTAGYPDYQPDGQRRDDYPTLAESVAHIAGLPAAAGPGAMFQYGGLAMQVAGRMAELAAGQDFDTIFQTRIARPLGMVGSGYAPVSTEPGFNPMLGGSLFTSTRDYARFLAMVAQDGRYQGRRVLSEGAVRELQADQVGGARVNPGEYVEAARQERRADIYGLGEWREEVDADGRPLLISSPGWAGAYAWLDKRAGIWGVVVAKANVGRAVADGYSTFLGSTIYAPMARAALEEAAQSATRRGTADIPGARLYYEESGSGVPVIFLHGHSFDRRQWEPQVAAFERCYRVIRYDLRGYGRSSLPKEGGAFLHADDLLALMDFLGIERAHLVGLSLGGFVVTDFLALHPQRVLSATMAGGDLFDVPGPDEPWTQEALARRRAEIAALKKAGITSFKQKWLEALVGGGGSARESLRHPLWRMIDEWQAWQPLHVEPRLLLGRGTRRRLALARPAMPVLLIRGDHERLDTRITEVLAQAELVTIPDCGHVSNLEQPAQFNQALGRFLAGSSS